MKYEGVVFDLDHTLFDRYATLTALAPDFCNMLGDYIAPAVTAKDFAEAICEGDKKYIYYGWKRVFEHLCEKGMFDPLPQYEQYRDTLLKLFTVHAVPFSFTYTVLEEMRQRGLKLGLITNGRGDIQAAKLKLLNLTDAFDVPLLCGEFGVQKPDRAPFDEMARRLNIPPHKLLYVGDNPKCDVDGSRNAGYTPVEVLTTDCRLPDIEPAKLQIKTVKELARLLDRLEA